MLFARARFLPAVTQNSQPLAIHFANLSERSLLNTIAACQSLWESDRETLRPSPTVFMGCLRKCQSWTKEIPASPSALSFVSIAHVSGAMRKIIAMATLDSFCLLSQT